MRVWTGATGLFGMVINTYARQLSQAEIDAKEHREFVGGLWEEVARCNSSI
jgi:hypothetical protein